MDAGRIGSVLPTHDDDDARDTAGAVVIPFAPRSRVRVRHLIAATVATFVAMSGLAVAGVLPDGLQRQIASVASEFGINLPNPDHRSTPAGSNGSAGTLRGDAGTSGGGNGAGAAGAKSGDGVGAGTGTTTTTQPRGVVGTPLTVPATAIPTVPQLPPVTAPPVTPPPASTPPILELPPVTFPPVSVPPLALPPLTLPPVGR